MSFKKIFLFFLIWRAFDCLILFFAPYFLPYLGFFPYKEILASFQLPDFLSKLANFDGVHYLLIAQKGYSQYQQAFFPLYPILIKATTVIFFGNSLIAGFMISNMAFLVGLYLFCQLLKEYQISNIKYLITILLLFPTSFFFGALYTEGLFFFLFASSLYFLKKEKYLLAAFFSFLTSLTRFIGVFLFIPILFNLIKKIGQRPSITQLLNYLITLFSPFLGFSFYSFYLWQTTGDPLFFLNAQPAFGANRSTHLILLPQVIWRYLKIFFTSSFNFQYFVSLFEFFIFAFVFFILTLDLVKKLKLNFFANNKYRPKMLCASKKKTSQISDTQLLGFNIFSFVNLLLPTLTGTFSSIPRYALFSLSFFIFLSQIKNKWIKILIAITFLIFHILSLAFFGQGYFIS